MTRKKNGFKGGHLPNKDSDDLITEAIIASGDMNCKSSFLFLIFFLFPIGGGNQKRKEFQGKTGRKKNLGLKSKKHPHPYPINSGCLIRSQPDVKLGRK